MIIRILIGFLLGGLLAFALRKREAPVKLQLVSVPLPPTADSKIRKPDGRIYIEAHTEEVYAVARKLEYFDELLASDVNAVESIGPNAARLAVAENDQTIELELSVIADSPGEFFGMRVEHNGVLYGTCLVRFEQSAGDKGTIAEVSVKFKDMSQELVPLVAPAAKRVIDHYLSNLKSRCESAKVAL